jgi:hypothetical protein
MKKTIGILIATVVFCACGNKSDGSLSSIEETQQNTTLSYIDEAEKLDNILQTYDKPLQLFQTTSKKPSTVTGALGTVVHVNPAILETFDGQPLGEKINIELKEYCTQVDLLRGNVATVSNGQLLVSGGAYYLSMSSDGNPLRIKEGKSLEVEFAKFSDEEMELFYGQRDSLGQMNWQVAQQQFRAREVAGTVRTTDVLESFETGDSWDLDMVVFETDYKVDTVKTTGFSKEELEALKKQKQIELKKQNAKTAMYQAIKINQLGWINVDRFFKFNNRTQLLIAFDESANIQSASVFLVFRDMNSVIHSFYYSADSEYTEPRLASFKDIPVGRNVRLIAYGFDEQGELYIHGSDLTIEKDEKLFLNLQKASNNDLDKLFAHDLESPRQ